MRNVLVIVTADPRKSDRAFEALRMCVGLALAENHVRIRLLEGAEALADPEGYAFPGWPTVAEHLRALRDLGGELVEEGSVSEWAERSEVVIRWTP